MSALLVPAGLVAVGVLAAGVYHPNVPLFGRAIGSGPRAGRRLYLTFDDGPNPEATDRILDTLEAERVPAAFFMVGDHVGRFPAAARRATILGHEMTHVVFQLCRKQLPPIPKGVVLCESADDFRRKCFAL